MSKPKVILNLQENNYSQDTETLLHYFSKDQILLLLHSVVAAIRKLDVACTGDSTPEGKLALKTLKTRGTLVKRDSLVKFLSCFSADLRNIKAMADVMMPEMNILWQTAIRQPGVSTPQVKDILHRELVVVNENSSWYPRFAIEALAEPFSFEYAHTYDRIHRYKVNKIFLPQYIRKDAVNIFIGPEILNPPVLEELPENRYHVESFVKFIDADATFLASVFSCNNLTSSLGSMTQVRLNSLSKKMKSPDFSHNVGSNVVDRKALLILAFTKFAQSRESDQSLQLTDFVKFIYNDLGRQLVSADYQIMLPLYKGFTKPLAEGSRIRSINKLIKLLIGSAADGWLDMSNFLVRYICNDDLESSRSAYTGLFNSHDFRKYSKLRDADAAPNSTSHASPDMWEDLTRPYIVHFIKLLCATGIIEMAIDPEVPESDPMEGIAYVRLTELGKYAYGLTDTYEGEAVESGEVFDLDKDNLIVTLLDKDSPYAMFLDQIGTKIGGNRYHITAKSMIAKSTNTEVVSRLNNFKRIVCPEPEGIWAAMIEETEKRISPTLEIKGNYALKHLDTKVPGLVETILHDAEIRKNTILAQDGYILISSLYYEKFKAKLRHAGYLL